MSFYRPALLTRPAAAILAACAFLAVIVITHHPVVQERRPSQALAGIARLAAVDRTVHTVLIIFILLMLYAFAVYAFVYRGRLLLGVGALAIFAVGAASVIAAALVDGFFTPAFAARYGVLPPWLMNYALPILTAGAIAIQILTKFGFYAFCSAALLWAIELCERGGMSRIPGVIAGLAALVELALLAFTGTLNPQNLALIALLQAVWCGAFAWQLWSLQDPSSADPREIRT